MALFKIFTDKEGFYRFLLKSDRNYICFISKGFSTKLICLKNLKLFKTSALDQYSYSLFKTQNGSPYFVFKITDSNAILGVSESFLNDSDMKLRIQQIKNSVVHASIDNVVYTM